MTSIQMKSAKTKDFHRKVTIPTGFTAVARVARVARYFT